PEYDAISYTWGSGGKSHRITVSDGVGKPLGELAVTANVRHILRQLESGKGPRYVWIDSICINQDDNIEKAAQVTHMGTFYSRAARVLICL
ncbi:heterokaryon incompatibility, partial [Thozetella sp. PMI_491]